MKILVCKHCGASKFKTGQNHTFCSKGCYKAHYKSLDYEYQKEYRREHPAKQLIKSAKSRAAVKGIEFNLSEVDITPLPTHCPILGIELISNVGTGAGGKDNSYSLDRIDPTIGYVKGNVQVISHKANSMKFTATKEELLLFSKWITNTYGS